MIASHGNLGELCISIPAVEMATIMGAVAVEEVSGCEMEEFGNVKMVEVVAIVDVMVAESATLRL
uniref:Uncharacterized protein n=1 Tax=Romanomermis culicivorax TaxID=13658 RepID=A0A915J1Z3_ROMCU